MPAPPPWRSGRRRPITVSLHPDLIALIDALVARGEALSRPRWIEEVLWAHVDRHGLSVRTQDDAESAGEDADV